ncbi:MAG: ROK family protein, partial [Pirellulales bacterium]|nr:ROK family protein [Pirellulales bacterium]
MRRYDGSVLRRPASIWDSNDNDDLKKAQLILSLETLTKQTLDGREVCLRVGVDMGGSDIKFGATDLAADNILRPDLIKLPSLTEEGPQKTISQIVAGIQGVLEELGAAWTHIAGIAVTVPCPCSAGGAILEVTNLGTPETKHLWEVPFGELLAGAVRERAACSIPVFACNDANAAGQDDDFTRYGHKSDARTSVFITTGTGLGGCVISGGSVFYGLGQAGELGHLKVVVPASHANRFEADPNPACGCGGYQCVETRASLTGLIRRLGWALSEPGTAMIRNDLAGREESVNADVLMTLKRLYQLSPRRAAYEVRSHADRDQDPFCRWLL